VSAGRLRVEVMHGVNLDMLGRRDPAQYGTLTLTELQETVDAAATELGFVAAFFQTNSESAFVQHLHRVADRADALILNPGAWTHYSWAIHDALEIAGLPAVEVHLSDVRAREEWRRLSVIEDLCLATVAGRGVEGYRDALMALRERFALPDAR
jgi:3-dehydroquinate dehydratase-2